MMGFMRTSVEEENELECPNCGFHYTRLNDIYSIAGNGCCEECIDELIETGVVEVENLKFY